MFCLDFLYKTVHFGLAINNEKYKFATMTHIKRIDEMYENVNESSMMSQSSYEEHKFEGKLVDICNGIIAHSDDIWKISEVMSNMSRAESSRFSTNDIEIASNKSILYINFQKYDDKRVLFSVYTKDGKKYVTLTVEVPSYAIGHTLYSTLLFNYDLSDKHILDRLSKFFKCHYASYNGKGELIVDLTDKAIYWDESATMSGDEFIELVKEFGKEFDAFIQKLKNDLEIA